MPRIDLPRSDLARLAFLQQAAQAATNDQRAGRSLISPACLAAVQTLAEIFGGHYRLLSHQLGLRQAAVRSANQAQATLMRQLRNLWELVRRRVRAEGEPVSVLKCYQLPEHGPKPCPGTRRAWIELAQSVITGDAAAQALGAPPPAYPTIAMLQSSLQHLRTCQVSLLQAERELQATQYSLRRLRPQVDRQLRYLLAELRLALFDRRPSAYRRVARRYGAHFRPLPGEPAAPAATRRVKARVRAWRRRPGPATGWQHLPWQFNPPVLRQLQDAPGAFY